MKASEQPSFNFGEIGVNIKVDRFDGKGGFVVAWLMSIWNWLAGCWRPSDEHRRYQELVRETEEYRANIQRVKTEAIEQIKDRTQLAAEKINEQERLRDHDQLNIVRESMVELGQIIQAANAQANHFDRMRLTAKCPSCSQLIEYSGRLIGQEISCSNSDCERKIQLSKFE
jgi:hypothetical protein